MDLFEHIDRIRIIMEIKDEGVVTCYFKNNMFWLQCPPKRTSQPK